MAYHWLLAIVFNGYAQLAFTITFAVLFSWAYARRYACHARSDRVSYVTVISGLTFSLLTMLMVPIDVFFASWAKEPDGTWSHWALNNSIVQNVEDTIEDTYFAFYTIVLLYLFVLLPFVYFYSEDMADPILESSLVSRIRRAILFSLIFPLALGVMLTVGAVIPMRKLGDNSTEWDWLVHELKENKGQDAFGFVFSILSVIGFCTLIMYLGLGIMAFPLSLIRGFASAAKERVQIQERLENLRARIAVLKARVQMGNGTQEDYHVLTELQQHEADTMRQERSLMEFQSTWFYRFRRPIRTFQVVLGFGGLLLSFLVLVSLLLTNVDKVFNSGPDSGYILKKSTLPNPLDYFLLQCQKAHPMDYIMFLIMVCYLFACCIYAIQRFGIWVCCFRVFSIRRGKTLPQALVMLSAILILCVFGLNIMVYSISPLYTSFGNQHYIGNDTLVRPCDYDAPPNECIQTRATLLLSRFNYKMAAFGFGYYWLSWMFIMTAVASYFVFQFKVRTSAAQQRIDEEEEDLLE